MSLHAVPQPHQTYAPHVPTSYDINDVPRRQCIATEICQHVDGWRHLSECELVESIRLSARVFGLPQDAPVREQMIEIAAKAQALVERWDRLRDNGDHPA
jgi:hypothetical protein